ncbi:hypothetical protein LMG27174_07111 [Paraburkholderia rhynchosiae]|uniref:Uncharacterized protein n=1 Tax=Paraburkholderia rhynchosiae TaxID=487049 RepID=A0A6J5CT61_9BURK|nr:hypothetical protein LMG27174_07111 [Paraburkholderia rhynchosiae]
MSNASAARKSMPAWAVVAESIGRASLSCCQFKQFNIWNLEMRDHADSSLQVQAGRVV